MTKQNGVDVRPNAAVWMRDELRSKVGICLSRVERWTLGVGCPGSTVILRLVRFQQ